MAVYDFLHLMGIIVIDFAGQGYPSLRHRLEVEYAFQPFENPAGYQHFMNIPSLDGSV